MSERVGDLTVEELKEIILAVPKTYFVEEVEKIVDKKLDEMTKNFWVPAEKHYQHHLMHDECAKNKDEWVSNHEFVSNMRKNGQTVWNVGLKLAVVSVFGFMVAMFNEGFRSFIVGLMPK